MLQLVGQGPHGNLYEVFQIQLRTAPCEFGDEPPASIVGLQVHIEATAAIPNPPDQALVGGITSWRIEVLGQEPGRLLPYLQHRLPTSRQHDFTGLAPGRSQPTCGRLLGHSAPCRSGLLEHSPRRCLSPIGRLDGVVLRLADGR